MSRPATRSVRRLRARRGTARAGSLGTAALAAVTLGAVALGSVGLGASTAPARAEDRAAQAAAPAAAHAAAPTAGQAARQQRPARAGNVVTPGNFTGYGFDQCLAPTQDTMDAWLEASPFLSVGIYISGDSRACRSQPNLTPEWIRSQLRKGWRLLPITLGPQASCQPRFPRYSDDFKISARPGPRGRYGEARGMARDEADKAVATATALGIVPGSTLWYDLEGYDNTNTACRESALAFLSAWTTRLHELGYVSGVYSSAGSGIKDLDDARVNRPGAFDLPDQLWIARWDGRADTTVDEAYLRSDGWQPHARVKQYQGGHDEVWGGVRINIDRNFLDVGRGSWAAPETHCGGVRISFRTYLALRPAVDGRVSDPDQVLALKCLLTEKGTFTGRLNGVYNARVRAAVHTWQDQRGFPVRDVWSKKNWMSLLVAGPRSVLKFGSAGPEVRRLQRTLNAAASPRLRVNGVFRAETDAAVRQWQERNAATVSGVVTSATWSALVRGNR